MSDLISDADLARARQDPGFRKKLMTENLEMLLGELNRMRKGNPVPDVKNARLIREGVDLAVKLADRLQRDDDPGPQAA